MTLEKYVSIINRINRIDWKILDIIEKQRAPRIPSLSDMPKGGGSMDTLTDYVIRLETLREERRKLYEIIEPIDTLLSPAERTLMKYRYIHEYSWHEIAEYLCFTDRHIYRMHKNILKKFEKNSKNLEKTVYMS